MLSEGLGHAISRSMKRVAHTVDLHQTGSGADRGRMDHSLESLAHVAWSVPSLTPLGSEVHGGQTAVCGLARSAKNGAEMAAGSIAELAGQTLLGKDREPCRVRGRQTR